MQDKRKYSLEVRIEASKRYLSGKESARKISIEMGFGKNQGKMVKEWAFLYRDHGVEGLKGIEVVRSYTAELKKRAVEDFLERKGTAAEICSRYLISCPTVLLEWVKIYKDSKDLKDFNIQNCPDDYQPNYERLTDEKRREIIAYCLERGNSIKSAAIKYGLTYGMVRGMVERYIKNELKGSNPKTETISGMLKRTSLREREEIVTYCLEHDNDYKGTAQKYGVLYRQVYKWVEYRTKKRAAGSKIQNNNDASHMMDKVNTYDEKPIVLWRKTTLEEREEIVQYCIEHDNNYSATAEKYGVSYSQVYRWVKYRREHGFGLKNLQEE